MMINITDRKAGAFDKMSRSNLSGRRRGGSVNFRADLFGG